MIKEWCYHYFSHATTSNWFVCVCLDLGHKLSFLHKSKHTFIKICFNLPLVYYFLFVVYSIFVIWDLNYTNLHQLNVLATQIIYNCSLILSILLKMPENKNINIFALTKIKLHHFNYVTVCLCRHKSKKSKSSKHKLQVLTCIRAEVLNRYYTLYI